MPSLTTTAQSLFDLAQTLVQNVPFVHKTLYTHNGVQYNTYSYDFAQDGPDGPVTPANFPLPVTGEVRVGWSQDGQNYSRAKGYPFVGSVSGLASPPTQYLSVTDCSGFVAYGVQNVDPQAFDDFMGCIPALKAASSELADIDRRHTQPWPSAADYAFAGSYAKKLPASWKVVWNQEGSAADLASAQPGDVLAWDAPKGSIDTGHVMVLAAAPAQVGPGTFQVQVFDASILPHIGDGGSRFHPGTGVGTVQIGFSNGEWQVGFDAFPPGTGNAADHVSILSLGS